MPFRLKLYSWGALSTDLSLQDCDQEETEALDFSSMGLGAKQGSVILGDPVGT